MRLAIRLDDLGLLRSIDEASIRCCIEGVACSVEVMAVGPRLREVCAELKLHPAIDVGVHFALTSNMSGLRWKPLTAFPCIEPDGSLPRTAVGLKGVAAESCLAELRAQARRVQELLPGRVTHLSRHHGGGSDSVPSELLAALGAELGLFTECDRSVAPLRFNLPVLSQISSDLVVVEHAADSESDMLAAGDTAEWAHRRVETFKVLCDPALADSMKRSGIEIVNYAALRWGRE